MKEDSLSWFYSEATVNSRDGIHGRPASQICIRAMEYEGRVEIDYNGDRIDAKSAIGILSRGIKPLSTIGIYVQSGEGCQACAFDIVNIIQSF